MTATVPATRQRSPYVGPRPFRRGEKLYGREREAVKLTDLLIAGRVVLLHSPPGAGKTSLIEAELVPRLEAEDFNVLPSMRLNIEPPLLASPPAGFNRYAFSAISTVEAALASSRQRPPEELAGLRLPEYLNQLAGEDDRDQVLIFDQFEEILTVDPSDWDGQDTFFRQVGAALADREHDRWALFSMREEYIGSLDRYARRIPTYLEVTFRLNLLHRHAALRAVQQPAMWVGVTFSDTAAQELVDDLSTIWSNRPGRGPVKLQGPYVEPVQLQVVCHRLWSSLGANGTSIKEIKPKHLERFRDVDRALADYYADGVRTVADET